MKKTEEEVKAISAVSAAVVKAWNDANYEAFMDYIDQDVVLYPPGANSMVGFEMIKTFYSDFFKAFTFEVEENLDEITVFGDYGYTIGTWVGSMNPVDGSKPIHFNNAAMCVYKRQPDGKWLVYRNIYNSNE